MQLQFQKQEVPCLRSLLTRVQTLEQTQEVSLPEGRDGGEILGVWGQILLRSKERQGDRLMITGGILSWVLLDSGEGEQPQTMDTWIPFRLDWDLPANTGEGTDRVQPVLSSMDARWISAGKLMIRAGISVLAQCWQPEIVQIPRKGEVPQDVELLIRHWPVHLPKESGEKQFTMEEELNLPVSAPEVAKILSYRLEPSVTDRKVMGDKIVFRGSGNLHIVYLCPEGKVRSWSCELPFSQYAELSSGYSSDARVDVLPAMTQLELELTEAGKMMLQAGLTAQYLVEDRQILETVTDAYSPRREVSVDHQILDLPVILDTRREMMGTEQVLPVVPAETGDIQIFTDMPRITHTADKAMLELPRRARVLYYDGEGNLKNAVHRWTDTMELDAGEKSVLWAVAGSSMERLLPGQEGMVMDAQVPVTITAMDGAGIPMVAGLDLGEVQQPDPERPSLILRRAGGDSLWDLARQSGSSVEAIRRANGLEAEPEPERMLLIPVI